MKRLFYLIIFVLCANILSAQQSEKHNSIIVPTAVQSALQQKYPEAKNVTWEKEKGNYEANWGGKSGEDNSVQFKPSGAFIEIVNAIPVSNLPKNVMAYAREHHKSAFITEAGKVTDSKGAQFYEAEIKGRDFLFDKNGNFIKSEK